MCGIVGYLGKRRAETLLIDGLSKLEYRGYDSAGVAILAENRIEVRKVKGRLANLEADLNESPLEGFVGVGHTRWATHGAPSVTNSHPHLNKAGTIAVVHNGIIENYLELREWLGKEGYSFVSETDTEVVPHLVDYYYKGDLLEAVLKTVEKLKGSYALGVISKDHPNKLIGVRKDSPLIVGLNEEKNEYYIASDIPAVIKETRKVYLLDDKEVVVLEADGAKVYNYDGNLVNKEVFNVTWDADAAEKGGYAHFMLKEIMEQPKVISDTMKSRIELNQEIRLDTINITKKDIAKYNRLYIVACGTAYHAGLVGKTLIEKLAKIPVEVDIASEFRYREPLIDDKTLMIVVSQSGETADTLAALKLAKSKGARVIGITNVVGSNVSREATDVLYTWAGPEIAVASTKAYVSQLIAMYIIALYFAENKETLTKEEINAVKEELLALPEKVTELLKCIKSVEKLAEEIAGHNYMFFLGRGLDYAVALEGSLKVKEISYIHSEAYGAGELKHGPIALIEDGTYVVALATQTHLVDKMISNIKEVKTRGAKVLGVTLEGEKLLEKAVDEVLYIPKVDNLVAPVLEVIPMQLLAYYTSIKKGCDVDKPRNLAKSVTVE